MIISFRNTIPEPWTMMIESLHARIAIIAVKRPGRTEMVARYAVFVRLSTEYLSVIPLHFKIANNP